MPHITFIVGKEKKTVEAQPNQTLLEAAQANGIEMEAACGGNGFCMTCKCRVRKGMEHLSALNDREENMGMSGDDRLGCQTKVQGDAEVEIAS